jgi:HD-GYP domain-containing protein (c-di-GMP phosphodiesterase class II)
MRRHPEHTFHILSRVTAFRPLAKVAAAHHEKLDGSGYHLGLQAEQLPPAARILAVADICEALTADRPYRGPLPLEKVMSILAEDVPDKLDAECYAALQAHLGVA